MLGWCDALKLCVSACDTGAFAPLQKWSREGATWAQARATNASRRDFTVNGLLYEPFRWAGQSCEHYLHVLACTALLCLAALRVAATTGAEAPQYAPVRALQPPPILLPIPSWNSRLLFDSVGGLEDCRARRLRTICPPAESFAADPARILRGVRLAARASEC